MKVCGAPLPHVGRTLALHLAVPGAGMPPCLWCSPHACEHPFDLPLAALAHAHHNSHHNAVQHTYLCGHDADLHLAGVSTWQTCMYTGRMAACAQHFRPRHATSYTALTVAKHHGDDLQASRAQSVGIAALWSKVQPQRATACLAGAALSQV